MVKEAFKRLDEARREQLLDQAMALYLQMPVADVTIRELTQHLGVNMATFYRWFDDKNDLPLEIMRRISKKAAPSSGQHVFDEFAPTEQFTPEEERFLCGTLAWPLELQARLFFEVNVSVYGPLVKQYLQVERLDGRLRDNVTDEFVAFLYVTMEFNLQRFVAYAGINDLELYSKLKDYMLHDLLPHGIMKEQRADTKDTER